MPPQINIARQQILSRVSKFIFAACSLSHFEESAHERISFIKQKQEAFCWKITFLSFSILCQAKSLEKRKIPHPTDGNAIHCDDDDKEESTSSMVCVFNFPIDEINFSLWHFNCKLSFHYRMLRADVRQEAPNEIIRFDIRESFSGINLQRSIASPIPSAHEMQPCVNKYFCNPVFHSFQNCQTWMKIFAGLEGKTQIAFQLSSLFLSFSHSFAHAI